MLIKYNTALEDGCSIQITKTLAGKDVSLLGSFSYGQTVTFFVEIPRLYGVRAAVLRLSPDGEESTDRALRFSERRASTDVYTLELDSVALCGEERCGLFYYEFLFLRGLDTLFTDSINNVDFRLSHTSANKFRLLIHQADFCPPAWFYGTTMYHIFLDRFFRGGGTATLHDGASLNPDWQNGIPQYASKPGEPLANDVFFGGNLWGVTQKLDYLQELGVQVLYLSPVFEASSNHRYDTGDYERIDALLGGEEAFSQLITQAHIRGMRIILDGVFNHTGDDSKYFNRRSRYQTEGAYQSTESPYTNWYHFRKHPDDYESWWGIEILPRLNHEDLSCRQYFTGENGIVARWLRAGADGWRLDVADELSDTFLEEMRSTVQKETAGEGLLIGEVWENAVDKMAYGKRRRYFWGGQLDSVMNYPFRNAVLAFLQNKDAETFYHILTELYASYPIRVSHSLMNLLGTHDTERILTVLGTGRTERGEKTNAQLSVLRLTKGQRAKAIRLLKIAATLQFTVFGVPSVYYGDEAGLEGYHDPFCRMPYPWGREDGELMEHYRWLGAFRQEHTAFQQGDFRFVYRDASAFAFTRTNESECVLVAANMGKNTQKLPLEGTWKNALTGRYVSEVSVESQQCVVLYQIQNNK